MSRVCNSNVGPSVLDGQTDLLEERVSLNDVWPRLVSQSSRVHEFIRHQASVRMRRRFRLRNPTVSGSRLALCPIETHRLEAVSYLRPSG